MNTRLLALITALAFSQPGFANCNSMLNYETRKLHSTETINLCDAYQGQVIVVVNTASQCGYTPQFKTLETLHQKYKDQGLVVLGFPSDDFYQEHSDETKTANVCYINYGVTFQMLGTSSVRGANANPIFKSLAEQTGRAPRWNFSKYVIGKDGKAIAAFPSSEPPMGGQLENTVVEALRM